MKKINKKVLTIVERATRSEVVKNTNSSFPACFGFFHQPVRPRKRNSK